MRLPLALRGLHEARYLVVEVAALVEERRESRVGEEEGRAKRDGPRARSRYDSTRVAAHLGYPVGELFGAADRGGEQKHSHARRRKDYRLFPDVAALFVGEVVSFIKNNQVC